MEVEKLSMAERLQKIKDGYPAHVEFPPCAIWSFANTPMSAYLDGFDTEMTALAEILGIFPEEFENYTYKEVAHELMELRDSGEDGELFGEAVLHLTAPIRFFWNARKSRLEKP